MARGTSRRVRGDARTVDALVDEVRQKLADPTVPILEQRSNVTDPQNGKPPRRRVARSGEEQRDRVIQYLKSIRSREDELAPRVHQIRKRKHTAFFATVGNLKKPELVLDVRIHGRSVGLVTIPDEGDRLFTPMAEFEPEGWEDAEWRSNEVRELLEAARAKIEAERAVRAASRPKPHGHVSEAMIQQAAFETIAGRGAAFRGIQPVLLFDLPFQFPMPLKGSEKRGIAVSKEAALGHADILVRIRPSTLAVLEIKRPGWNGARTALSQAVAYAAALEVLLEKGRGTILWALGYAPERTAPIRIEAWAVVDAADEEAVRANAAELQVSNHHYPLRAWLYDFTDGKFQIVRKIDDLGDPMQVAAGI